MILLEAFLSLIPRNAYDVHYIVALRHGEEGGEEWTRHALAALLIDAVEEQTSRKTETVIVRVWHEGDVPDENVGESTGERMLCYVKFWGILVNGMNNSIYALELLGELLTRLAHAQSNAHLLRGLEIVRLRARLRRRAELQRQFVLSAQEEK